MLRQMSYPMLRGLALISLLFVVGCAGSSAQVKSEPASPSGQPTLPGNYPQRFPTYPGAVLVSVEKGDQGGKPSQVVTFSTPDPVDQVVAFYTAQRLTGFNLN